MVGPAEDVGQLRGEKGKRKEEGGREHLHDYLFLWRKGKETSHDNNDCPLATTDVIGHRL